MHYKTNRQNHDFQIAYFLVSACQTADAAYGLLYDLRQDRKTALDSVKAASLRTEAKIARAQRVIDTPGSDRADVLEAQADLLEIEAMAEMTQANIDACVAELAFIDECIARIKPLRKYAHLPDAQAFEAAQREEWKLSLMRKAENYLCTQGTIPHDYYDTMRLHPDFKSDILPHVGKIAHILESKPRLEAMSLITGTPESEVLKALPKLEYLALEAPKESSK